MKRFVVYKSGTSFERELSGEIFRYILERRLNGNFQKLIFPLLRSNVDPLDQTVVNNNSLLFLCLRR